MTVLEIIIYIIGGLLMLFIGAEGVIRGSSSLALHFGITPLVVGLTVVALGTSSPELVVSLKAALEGNGNISLGNVIGSNIANIALILGTAALIRPMKVVDQVVRREVPIMIFVSLLLVLFLINDEINRIEGIIFFIGILFYSVISVYLSQKEKSRTSSNKFTSGIAQKPLIVWQAIFFFTAGLALLILGADVFIEGAVAAAERLGMNQAVIGLTVMSFGTSLPELVTASVASFKNKADLAIGNVVGSNIYNILLILGITAMIIPIRASEITMVDLGVMVITAIIVLLISRTKFTLNRWEGALLLSGYVIYIYYLLPK